MEQEECARFEGGEKSNRLSLKKHRPKKKREINPRSGRREVDLSGRGEKDRKLRPLPPRDTVQAIVEHRGGERDCREVGTALSNRERAMFPPRRGRH